VVCYLHPDLRPSRGKRTKTVAAQLFAVSSQGFRAREIAFSTEALDLIKEGKIELPLATESDVESERVNDGLGGGVADSNGADWEGMLAPSRRILLNVDKLQKALEKRCTRSGIKN
jgi:hypothetical protein